VKGILGINLDFLREDDVAIITARPIRYLKSNKVAELDSITA
jgi:hypothetical protein